MNYEVSEPKRLTPLTPQEEEFLAAMAKDLSPAQKAALKREIELLPCEEDDSP